MSITRFIASFCVRLSQKLHKFFTRDAVEMIFERSSGIPRPISVLADNALLTGFAAGQRPVGVRIVQEVCRDFDLPGAPAAVPLVAEPVAAPPAPSAARSSLATRWR